jgi:hypothetical protein
MITTPEADLLLWSACNPSELMHGRDSAGDELLCL